jgi:TonB family protein
MQPDMEPNRDPENQSGAGMNAAATTAAISSLELDGYSDDLARFCLEPDRAESNRRLAWINSICLVYLIIGVLGLRPPPLEVSRRVSLEEAVPTIIEPVVNPLQQVSPDSGPEAAASEPSASDVIAVTLDSPAVAFSVPTVGNLLVPSSMAQAPPAHPMQGAVPLNTTKIEIINTTGTGGRRPAPPYPYDSMMHKEQGTVVLLIEVDQSGRPSSVTVKEPSGYSRLDRTSAEWVKRYWFFGPGAAGRLYESPIVFQLQ